jgi:hypothetical protein
MNKTPEQRSALGLPPTPTNDNHAMTYEDNAIPLFGVLAIYILGCLTGIFASICAFLYMTA